ncbi:MAG: ChuX/HutX family heme-like substrate-binding protein [Calditrichota bacterium]
MSANLKQQWNVIKSNNPRLRIRDAATELGVSEAELLATDCGSDTTLRLEGDWKELLKRIPDLGKVMALTRNDSAVSERKGNYENVDMGGHWGLVLGKEIDLRLNINNWKYAYAVVREMHGRTLRSVQFFDQYGTAVHKIYLQDEEYLAAFNKLVADYTSKDQSQNQSADKKPQPEPEKPDSMIDKDGFLEAWSKLQDTHDYFPMLKDYGVSRIQAMRLAEGVYTRQVDLSSLRYMLESAAEKKLPIMNFVGNTGAIQIFTGTVERLKVINNYYNILDTDFNLHVREDLLGSAWVVEKPTEDGLVTSLEFFDKNGQNIMLFFGARKPGIPELKEWRELVKTIQPKN